MAQGPLKVHRSVKTRLEARGIALAHPESSSSDTHVDEDKVYTPIHISSFPSFCSNTSLLSSHRALGAHNNC